MSDKTDDKNPLLDKSAAAPTRSNFKIQQHNVSGPNVVSGNVTIHNPPVNPNAAVVTYNLIGVKRTTRPGRTSLSDEDVGRFQDLKKIYKNQNWSGLIEESDKQIAKTPEWLTPYYLKSIGLANLGQLSEAIALLEHVDKQTTGDNEYERQERRRVGFSTRRRLVDQVLS